MSESQGQGNQAQRYMPYTGTVSVPFFAGVLGVLSKLHGSRIISAEFDEIYISSLAPLEHAYQKCEPTGRVGQRGQEHA